MNSHKKGLVVRLFLCFLCFYCTYFIPKIVNESVNGIGKNSNFASILNFTIILNMSELEKGAELADNIPESGNNNGNYNADNITVRRIRGSS